MKFIGLTTHVAFREVYEMIDTGMFDQVLLARGYIRAGMHTLLSNANIEWRERCVARADELGMAIVVMKIMARNMLGRGSVKVVSDFRRDKHARLPAAAIRWVLRDKRVSMLNIGISVPEDIDRNIGILSSDVTFTRRDRMLLSEFAQKAYESETLKALKSV